jgi:hypothetical protein
MAPPADVACMRNDKLALEDLARRLGDERQVVTYLLYKLTVTLLMLAADERRFVPDALEEVERAVELLREGELRRHASLRELASLWMVDPGTLTLTELARRSPPPFHHVFADHLAGDNIEDLDIAEGLMELHLQQVGYEATLQTLGRALPPSLAAFLR